MITLQAVFRVTQTTSRHLPDTLRHLPDNPKSIYIGVVKGIDKNFLLLLGKALMAPWQVPFLLMTLDWPLSVLFWGVLGCLSDSGYCVGWGGVSGGVM